MTEGHRTLPGPPHPLARALVGALSAPARVLIVGAGSGRHVPVLRDAGFTVETIEVDDLRAMTTPGAIDGALSTHALLHGRPAEITAALACVRDLLRPGAPFYFTLGSTADPRFGHGTRIDDATWAPNEGSETGVPHAYFDERGASEFLVNWEIESLESRSAAETAGRWAHTDAEAATLIHWFVRARKRF